MIAEADVAGDGKVDYSEFAHLWKTSALLRHHKPVANRLQDVRTGYDAVGSSWCVVVAAHELWSWRYAVGCCGVSFGDVRVFMLTH